eukprot:TRINITY_DN18913_c0_g1_i1.p1 TRINITY_DN18913_c0_g1~~TRINITY_DN18913_c0_g1_i1.p1  ORF type:complete len:407 (+),score=118.46 TRINITY_DN18913_c0_g1_i1:85-1221(+)
MTTPDLLTSVGFEKGKIGSGDKEVGYQIKESSMSSLLGSLLLCFAVMGFMVVSMVYDVHFERKTMHRNLRIEEHHAAAKLTQVQMELWSQYRDDVQESKEAQKLLKVLNNSYGEFETKFHGIVGEMANEIGLHPDKAAKLGEKVLHLVADLQQDNMKHAKYLLDHLVKAGKKSLALEKKVDKEIAHEIKVEKKHEDADTTEAEEPLDKEEKVPPTGHEAPSAELDEENMDEPLKAIMDGFWYGFNEHLKEIPDDVRSKMGKDSQVHKDLYELLDKVASDNPISEEEASEAINKIDLASTGLKLDSGRTLPITDIIEELALVPMIPVAELKELEKAYQAGSKDLMTVMSRLEELHEDGKIPSSWLQRGVNAREEKEMEE